MINRILLAGLLGGLALFIWEFVAHDVLPLGTAGLSALPDEAGVRAALKEKIPASGFFYFPAPVFTPGMTGQQKQAAMTKAMDLARTGPAGLMVFNRAGEEGITVRRLLTQFLADVVAIIVAGFLLTRLSTTGYGSRVLFLIVLSFFPGLRADLPMWNWYGFPSAYIAAEILIDVVGFALAGLIVARMVRSRPKMTAAAS
jgi:hypothetical protein